MIVNDLYFVSVSLSPTEANPPLVVDANAMLTLACSGQLLKSVARRDTEIAQAFRGVENSEFLPGKTVQVGREAS